MKTGKYPFVCEDDCKQPPTCITWQECTGYCFAKRKAIRKIAIKNLWPSGYFGGAVTDLELGSNYAMSDIISLLDLGVNGEWYKSQYDAVAVTFTAGNTENSFKCTLRYIDSEDDSDPKSIWYCYGHGETMLDAVKAASIECRAGNGSIDQYSQFSKGKVVKRPPKVSKIDPSMPLKGQKSLF